MAERNALLVTTAHYEDPRWNRLRGPGLDGASLGTVLADPEIGGFVVEYVADQPAHLIRQRVDRFLARRSTTDELLVYFSCHGAKDDDGRLFLVGTDTEYDRDLFESTAISAAFLNGRLANCRARSKMLVLDCCYSGAFDPRAKGFASADIADHLRGAGTAVLTATNELQLAWEDGGPSGAEEGHGIASVFTSVLVEGLRTGDADWNGDGTVDMDDLFHYASETMAGRGARQTPRRWLLGSEGPLVVARRAGAGTPGGPPLLPASFHGRTAPVDRAGRILSGITTAADALAVTVGPAARFVVLRDHTGALVRTSDAALAVRLLTPATSESGLGLALVRALVERMRAVSGDGTASAVVVLGALLRGLQPALAQGVSPGLLAGELAAMADFAGAALLPHVRRVETLLALQHVGATITGDRSLGTLIAKAMDRTGHEGVVKVEEVEAGTDGQGTDIDVVFMEDLRLACRRLAPAPSAAEVGGAADVVLDRPFVAVCDVPLSPDGRLGRLQRLARPSGRPLLVLIRAATAEAAGAAVPQADGPGAVVVAVEPEVLTDVAPWSGATLIVDAEALRHAGPEILGEARTATVTTDQVTLRDGAGDVAALSRRIDAIRGLIRQAPSASERDRQRERLAALFGALAVIRVSSPDEQVRSERAGAARAGVRGCRAAVEDGMLAGAAAALARAGRSLDEEYRSAPPHVKALATAMGEALAAPLLVLAENTGMPRSAGLREQLTGAWPESTYDAVSGTVRPTETAGVWDPLTVPVDLLRAVCDSARSYLMLL